MNQQPIEKLYTLKEACELLSISTATGRNWMKSGRLISVAQSGQKPVFEETALLSLKQALINGTIPGLKSRRNKSHISGKSTYHSYISETSKNHEALKYLLTLLEKNQVSVDDSLILCILRHCAEQLIASASYENTSLYEHLLNNLVDRTEYLNHKAEHPALYSISYTYLPEEDTLGFLYMSLLGTCKRKSSGSYYTPARLAKQLVKQHLPMLDSTKTVLDPSCGTGIFLLQLPKEIPLRNVYGSDLNPVSVTLTQINLALHYHITASEEIDILKHNIIVADFLLNPDKQTPETAAGPMTVFPWKFDIILGNPPWGARLSEDSKKTYQTHFTCANGSAVEIFDLFIEQSITRLAHQGILSFVLPESVFTVKTHTPVRKLLLQSTSVLSVEYLGEAFEQVHCPSVIFTVTKNSNRPFFKNVPVTPTNGGVYLAQAERTVFADSFSFLLTDEEYLLLEKLLHVPNHTTLVDNSVFALGIVTGNNASFLKDSPAPGLEPIIRGSNISRYHINSYSGYTKFNPEQFQQTAPEENYRAPEKLFYRFINKQLMFAYDDTGLLSLNSCNIVIPKIPGLSVKYILAILNSKVAQFIFEKKFHSVKVLRSHLEQIPIPLTDENTQKEIVNLVDRLINLEETTVEYHELYSLLDKKIAGLFRLTAEEYHIINNGSV